MTIKKYSQEAHKFSGYKEGDYPYYALPEEIGEFYGKIAKLKRGDYEYSENLRIEILKELGDICWFVNEICILKNIELSIFQNWKRGLDVHEHFENLLIFQVDLFQAYKKNIYDLESSVKTIMVAISEIANHYNSSLPKILAMNIRKLKDRKKRGVIQGDGDNR